MTHLLFNEMESQEHLMLMEAEYAMKSLKAEFDGQAKYIDSNIKLYGEAFGAGIAIAALIKTGIALLVKFFIAFKGIIVAVVTSVIAYLAKRKMGKRVDVGGGGGGGGGGSVASAGTKVKQSEVVKNADKKVVKSLLKKVIGEGNLVELGPQVQQVVDTLGGDAIETLTEMAVGMTSEQISRIDDTVNEMKINIDTISDNYVVVPNNFELSDRLVEGMMNDELYSKSSQYNSLLKSEPMYFLSYDKEVERRLDTFSNILIYENNKHLQYSVLRTMMREVLTEPGKLSAINTAMLICLIDIMVRLEIVSEDEFDNLKKKGVSHIDTSVLDFERMGKYIDWETKDLISTNKIDSHDDVVNSILYCAKRGLNTYNMWTFGDNDENDKNLKISNVMKNVKLAKESIIYIEKSLKEINDVKDLKVQVFKLYNKDEIRRVTILPKDVDFGPFNNDYLITENIGEHVYRDIQDKKSVNLSDFKKYCDASAEITKGLGSIVDERTTDVGKRIFSTSLTLTTDLTSILTSLLSITTKLTRQVNHPINKSMVAAYTTLCAVNTAVKEVSKDV